MSRDYCAAVNSHLLRGVKKHPFTMTCIGTSMIFRPNPFYSVLLAAGLLLSLGANADSALEQQVRKASAAIESQLIEWRRDIHQHPELGEQETRTAKLVADHLTRLGMEVRSNIARTGVVGILKGAKPGRTVALRADMDALPIKEPSGLPFASKAKGNYHGTEVDGDACLRPRCAHRHADGHG